MDIVKTLNGLIKDVDNGDIDTLAELQRELIYLRSELEQLALTDVSQQRELLIAYENKVGHMDKDEAIKFVDEYLNGEGN